MEKGKVKIVQQLLNITADGEFGPQTRRAIHNYYDFDDDWSDEQLLVGCIQVICMKNDFNPGPIDGWWGNKTSAAWDRLLEKCGITEAKIKVNQDVSVGKEFTNWPSPNYSSMVNFYGKVGTNQTSLILPFPMVLAWDIGRKITKVTLHTKVKQAFENFFVALKEHYGLQTIQDLRLDRFGGILNVRKMRGGSSWSHHSWGCVMDIDPDRNRLRWGRDKAYLAREEYKPFWKIAESQGMRGLGPAKNYDWMHFGCVKY